MNILFKILKIVSWGWVAFNLFVILLFLTLGEEIEVVHYILITALASPAIIFLLWRYKEEKEIREEKKKIKQERVELEKDKLRKNEEQRVLKKQEKEEIKSKLTEKLNVNKKIIVIAIVFVVIAGGFILNPTRKVKSIAKQAIVSVLKAPSTAEFGNYTVKNYGKTSEGNTIYTVEVDVDSQNGFGATIRSRFKISISKKGNKYNVYNFIKVK